MARLITHEQLQEGFLGKIVSVAIHMQSHVGKSREAVYVGDFSFATSCEELLDGKRVLRGYRGFRENLGEETGRFLIYNMSVPSERPERLNFTEENYQEALRLWDERQKAK